MYTFFSKNNRANLFNLNLFLQYKLFKGWEHVIDKMIPLKKLAGNEYATIELNIL